MWTDRQHALWHGLRGRTVEAWVAAEMAVREIASDGKPQWHDPTVPFLQLGRLDAVLEQDARHSIVTCQSIDEWELAILDLPPLQIPDPGEEHDEASIYRTRALPELPLGVISDIRVQTDDKGLVIEIQLEISSQHTVTLIPAEVLEERDGTLRIVHQDESILVQVDGRFPGVWG